MQSGTCFILFALILILVIYLILRLRTSRCTPGGCFTGAAPRGLTALIKVRGGVGRATRPSRDGAGAATSTRLRRKWVSPSQHQQGECRGGGAEKGLLAVGCLRQFEKNVK